MQLGAILFARLQFVPSKKQKVESEKQKFPEKNSADLCRWLPVAADGGI